jgi:hypothetical protein
VEETLKGQGDEFKDETIAFSGWVSKINPKGKVQKRLVVVAPFHIYSFKVGAFGKKGLQRCGHYFDLQSLHSAKPNEVFAFLFFLFIYLK